MAARIERDPRRIILITAAEVSGVDQRSPGGIQFGHKGVKASDSVHTI